MKAYITANNGYISATMDYVSAVIYAAQLEQLGNDNVRVVIK